MQSSVKAVPKRAGTPDPRMPVERGSWLDNLRLSWKIALIVAVLTLATLVIVLAGLTGLAVTRYHLKDLYQYTLVPVSSINKANTALADLVRYLEVMRNPQTSPGVRIAYLSLAQQADKTGDSFVADYTSNWVSTARPGFTQILQQQGQMGLQVQETATLKGLTQAHDEAGKALDAFFRSLQAGKPDPQLGQAAAEGYLRVRGYLNDLITLNDQFAKLSDDAALAAYNQAVQRMWIALGVALLLSLLLVVWITRTTSRRLGRLEQGAQSLRQGNLNSVMKVSGRDEIGALAQTFNDAVTQLRQAAQVQQQEQQRALQLQENVSRFLGVATEIAGGDLTKRGEITQDALGSVVDAVNLTVEEIALLLKNVREAADSVNSNAARMNSLTSSIAQDAQAQAQEATQVRTQTGLVSGSIRQMAERASNSAQAARQTLEVARLGREAVTQVMIGMNEVRGEIQSIAENITLLNTRSAQIESVAKTLEDFASQTNLLALNASFEAAGAGAAGRRFAVVAEEIRRLAEESAKETQRVGSLVRQVQTDIQTVVTQAQDGVREAETGYRVADTAGSRLQEIAKLAEQSAGLASQISDLAQAQVPVVEQVDAAVQKIAQAAQSVETESSQGRQTAEAVRALSISLSQNLSRFKLP